QSKLTKAAIATVQATRFLISSFRYSQTPNDKKIIMMHRVEFE
ncbi:791_t:CDS:1, partial [Dentiscutata erythropus]